MFQQGRHVKATVHHHWRALTGSLVLTLAVITGIWLLAAGTEQPDRERTSAKRPSVSVALSNATEDPAAAPTRSPTAAPTKRATAAATPAVDARAVVNTAVRSCRSRYAVQGRAVKAAERSLAQWRTHIDAMNQLVAGKIDYYQASYYWESTRIGAARRIREFHQADRARARANATCTGVGNVVAADADTSRLQSCLTATAARRAALEKARVTIGTWHHHVHNMNLLRAGKMSADRATQLWLRHWKQGRAELNDYRAAARMAKPTC